MAKKLNSMPVYKANLPRNPHDLSQSFTYTTVPGQLSPVYFDMLHHGDEIFFSASQFTRLNPLEKPFLGQIDVHLDYFFVPLTVMYLPSSSLFYQTDDLVSSAFSKNLLKKDTFPRFDFPNFLKNNFTDAELYDHMPYFNDVSNEQYQTCFDCIGKSVFRLWDLLDMTPEFIYRAVHKDSVTNYPLFTPWFALAYQSIYQLFYRNDDREPKCYNYNIDKYYNFLTFSEDLDVERSIFQLNYVSRPKDYFNAVKANPIGSAVSSLSGQALSSLYSQVNQWLDNGAVSPSNSQGVVTDFGNDSTQVRSTQRVTSSTIRNLFMVDKLLRVIGRSEKNYESQFLAHFGIKVPHDVMHNITHIGHDMISINAESVISSADTFDSTTGKGTALGEIGGQASRMLSGHKMHFKAPFHGVFMCISYIVPRRRYVGTFSKLHALSSPSDFYQPEFDKKGMQPLFAYETDSSFFGTSDFVGWQFGYEQFKRKYDRASSAFMPSRNSSLGVNTLSPWVLANVPYSYVDPVGSVSQRFDIQNPDELAQSLLVTPTDLNTCMIQSYNPLWPTTFGTSNLYMPWLIYASDPLICDFNMKFKKVDSMSDYSEPEL